MGGRGVTAGAAEPLAAGQALDYAARVMNAAIPVEELQRRQARERRDYLYRRALTLRDASIAEKRAQLKASLASGKPLDPSIAEDKSLREDFKYDESITPDNQNKDGDVDLDDEYALTSGIADPRPIVTTSRSPSVRLGTFAKEIRLLLPTSIRLNRGNLVLPDLVSSANAAALTDMILVHEHRGTPTAMTISHLPHGPTASFSLHNVVLRADIPNAARGTVSESYPHLIFEGFKTKLGLRVVQILKHLFPPRETGKVGNRVVSFVNKEDSIEVRHHVFVKTGYRDVELAEVGPRMTMRLFEIRGGTLEKGSSGDVEWALTQYTRTSKKKDYL
ncbi:Mitochondrial K+-H+ exchange-related family protein [Aspergillus niger]|uniref:U3 small nucleolar ribonucleoprotein protein IMP4 n=1 Tax=Aspergillus niger TaxID=5061 RepID=A0A505I2K4_ASPNG|nr:Mitochondrial K+-H+ exchange-related family protein [Aspergillus niger]